MSRRSKIGVHWAITRHDPREHRDPDAITSGMADFSPSAQPLMIARDIMALADELEVDVGCYVVLKIDGRRYFFEVIESEDEEGELLLKESL